MWLRRRRAPEPLAQLAEAAAAQGRKASAAAPYTGPRYGTASPSMLRREHERD